MKLLLPLLAILARVPVFADGGTVQLRKEAGDLVITLFTSTSPVSVGLVDISLLLQNRNGLDPVLDATVSLALRENTSNSEVRAPATREQARNKLLYAALVTFPTPGKWRIVITVVQHGRETNTSGTLDVEQAPGNATPYASYLAFPPAIIVLFVIRERLIRRRAHR